jgi:probable rRNA maturation factor
MIFVETNDSLPFSIPPKLLERAALTALSHQAAPSSTDLTIVLTDDAQLHKLNRQWMGVDAPTDVLSFPSDETDPDTGSRYLGDILISVPYAARQAAAGGHSVEAETQLLVVHGVLHLMGHDHAEADEKTLMWQAQKEILTQLELGNIIIRDE